MSKYIAMIMNRRYMGDNKFIFNVSHAEIGEIDETTGKFIDRNENSYDPMLSENSITSAVPVSYCSEALLSELNEILEEDLPTREAIAYYEYLCKGTIYYVSQLENGQISCNVINMDEIDNQVENALRSENMNVAQAQEKDETTDKLIDINTLLSNISKGKYSKSELESIKSRVEDTYSAIEEVLNRIEQQVGNTKKETSKNSIDINEVFNKVTKTLIAQDEPVRRLIVEIVRKEMTPEKKEDAILLTGDTGVGKTKLLKLLAKYLNKPLLIVDSTQLTIPGYKGRSLEDILWDLYVKCGENKEKAESAIIYFDEIDKKGSPGKSDVSGQGVLNTLLPLITGTEYIIKSDINGNPLVKLDTTNMIKVLGGAYTDVYKSLNKKSIGIRPEIPTKEKTRKATPEDFVNNAMMTDEFMGRTLIIRMNSLDCDSLKRIMLESDESAIKIQQELFERLGTKLTFTDGYINKAALDAEKNKTGARGLNSVIDDSTWHAFDDVYSSYGTYSEVILDEKSLEDPKQYKLIKK